MSFIRTFWKCIFSPKLFNVYKTSYQPNYLEQWADRVILCFSGIWSIRQYTIPLVAIFFYQRGNSLSENLYTLNKLVVGAGAVFITSLAARGCSRACDKIYLKFLRTLEEAHLDYNSKTRQELHKYEFEFWAWPVDFKYTETDWKEKVTLESIAALSGRIKRQTGKEFIFTLPCKFLSYIVAHTFAIKMIYPGSASLIKWTLHSKYMTGRIKLIEQGGERYKLLTADNNELDTMFIDQRNKGRKGSILVITCEGNCGLYEIGIMSTPLRKGYSVLGWNHPGFGYSTGAPYPNQEEKAMDCVMCFAINHLNFPEERIILYGWSIGGYTATWAAMNYPSIKSLVLDATFDDILPLAIMTMPSSLEGLVRNIIRDYFNLNIAVQLNRYNGTVLLIRRTEDEILCAPNNTLSANPGNILLTKLLLRRYPHLLVENSEYAALLTMIISASSKMSMLETVKVDKEKCLKLIAADIEKSGGIVKYPSTLGQDCSLQEKQQLILFLVTMYMKDQSSSHCELLAVDLFRPGWDPMSALSTKE